jgi:hypothetical protein
MVRAMRPTLGRTTHGVLPGGFAWSARRLAGPAGYGAAVTAFFDDPDAAIDRVQADIRAAQERAVRAVEVKAALDRLRGRARSARGEVTAEVDPSGQLLDLHLADDAVELSARDLAALVLDTVRAAGREAGRQALAVTAEAFGEDSPVTEHLRGELAGRLR